MRTAVVLIAATWAGWWFTPDQRGHRLFRQGEYAQAAQAFQDPVWQGTAWYRAMEFKKAARSFARRSSPEARFNEGNAWLLMGKYDIAIANYDKALAQRPDWTEARENRDLAVARKKKMHSPGGDAGDQRLGADKIVFDRKKKQPGGQETQIAGQKAVSDASVQAIWLRQVQTKPADFLKAKFAYQAAESDERDAR